MLEIELAVHSRIEALQPWQLRFNHLLLNSGFAADVDARLLVTDLLCLQALAPKVLAR